MRRMGCVALLLLAGCPDPDCEPGWRAITDRDDAALLSVRGTASDDVWAVGGGLGLGGALARHWDGDAWRAIAIDDPRTLWWVWPSAPGRAWAVGEGGLIVQLEPDRATVIDAATTATLYGVWGTSDDDVWIVGDAGTVLHDLAPIDTGLTDRTFFKVWGAAGDDLWIAGERGTMLHWTGAGFIDHSAELATVAPALTVDGCGAGEVYAVAGARLYALDGDTWRARDDVTLGSVANGVACAADGVLIAGNGGLRARFDRAAQSWHDERLDGPWDTDYHAAWIDDAGVAWAAGGNFNATEPATRRGVLAVRGCPGPAGF